MCFDISLTRVMVDQLADTKDKYTGLYKESKRALQQFLQERTQISESLQQTYRFICILFDISQKMQNKLISSHVQMSPENTSGWSLI